MPGPKVSLNATAKEIREELFKITQENKWNNIGYWNDVIKSRTGILDSILEENLSENNWTTTAVQERVDAQFVAKAESAWASTQDDEWRLTGEWLHERKDIVRWFRNKYWKDKKEKEKKDTKKEGKTTPALYLGAAADTICVGSQKAAPVADETSKGGTASGSKGWKETVLQ